MMPIIYIILPFVFLIHDLEEIIFRRRWIDKYADEVCGKFPRMKPLIHNLAIISTFKFCVIVAEEFFLLLLTLFLFDKWSWLAYAAYWGFSIHLFMHIGQIIVLRMYVPGLITSFLLLLYIVVGGLDLLQKFSLLENLFLALGGFVVVALNLVLMHWLMRK
ncbi:MAG TPA: HXXEE domain-containing protein [Paludibacteraceae bacterium]|nr:HXXEE domain-containing protein [Paludibacteraceae bacterium]HOU69137.1 HXXEE domain-containing protein [Paludibacteraceae bacterium]HPH63456.1 HXXEE domain-containing protein [Paludibacteraceae bacterium]HQF50926.1 HXXEE domain-containing protein [Paludibacteraceae bacterium]HQJ89922.1 HXXEE domain-containing protein [Paludibacteraceae bacterium]